MRVAYLIRSWPRFSQTFIVNEVLALERRGVRLAIFAMARPDEVEVQPQVAEVRAPVHYLDESAARPARRLAIHLRVALRSPRRYAATRLFARRHDELLGGYTAAGAPEAFRAAALVADALWREARRGEPFTHLHAHFAHDPALIGVLVHRLTGLPFSFTAHARDLYQIPAPALRGRMREATTAVTCCRANVAYIDSIVGSERPPVQLIYHGTDLRTFRPADPARPADVPLIVSIGRLVEKKGFDDLLQACALLAARGVRFRGEIYGDGPLRSALEVRRDQLGLQGVVALCGERVQRDLVEAYHRADIFALTPRVTGDGDRDGIPNVLLEAMACGVPVVSTDVGGVTELIADGVNGLVSPPCDPAAVAANLGALLGDPQRRRRLGAAGRAVVESYDVDLAAARLAAIFSHEEAA